MKLQLQWDVSNSNNPSFLKDRSDGFATATKESMEFDHLKTKIITEYDE